MIGRIPVFSACALNGTRQRGASEAELDEAVGIEDRHGQGADLRGAGGSWGRSGISKSEVSRIWGELDAELTSFKGRPAGPHGPPLRVLGRHLLQGKGEPPDPCPRLWSSPPESPPPGGERSSG